MSLLGPTVVVQTVAIWFGALTVAMALVVHPALGREVQAQSGETPTDFVTAYRFAFLIASIVGFAVLSLVVTYLLQIYDSLHRRNTLGLEIEMLTAGKGGSGRSRVFTPRASRRRRTRSPASAGTWLSGVDVGRACALAETLGFSAEEIDVAGSKAAGPVVQRQPWGSHGGSSSPSFFY